LEFAKKFYEFLWISESKSPQMPSVEMMEEEQKHPQVFEDPSALMYLLDYRCIKSVMCRDNNNKEVVTIESFSALLRWFGPFTRTYHCNRTNLLTRIRKTLKYSAFHGFISSVNLRKKLTGFPTGTFAIRFSETTPGFFVLARVHIDGKITEGRIFWDYKKGFVVGNYSARTLTRFCKELRKKLNLQYICQRSCENLFEPPLYMEDPTGGSGGSGARAPRRNSIHRREDNNNINNNNSINNINNTSNRHKKK